MKSKNILLTIVFLIVSLSLFSQFHRQESELYFPDIKGYKTLKCDFHMHTVFSDGQVWPDYRVFEAINDGLDVIAITDHIEYRPHFEDLPADHNRSYEIAKETGDEYGIVVIHGAEITRDMPPGHLNALFISDANKLDVENVEAAIAEAINQGAFVYWNHPCWKAQQPDTVVWFDIHTKLYDQGFIHGIEIVNFSQFCPEAFNWAIEKDLTYMAGSDVHSTTQMSKFEKHRPVTLVFAKNKDEKSIHKALNDKMTLVFYNETMYGDEKLLTELLDRSLIIKKTYDKEKDIMIFDITNISSVPIILQSDLSLPRRTVPKSLTIGAKSNIHFHVDLSKGAFKSINFKVLNFIYNVDKELDYQLKL
ncbi:MAG: Sb-PDE family phosphodiesterase [Bacteroidales bacterium]|nr:Sb-PDE family phosphodiesterase [Bacteroidales bacterium]